MTTARNSANAGVPALECRGISKVFGGVKAVDEVSLAIEAGQIHGLIGPNGAGKSSLINLLSGLLPPDDGSVSLDGVDITSASVENRTERGLVRTFQQLRAFRTFTVEEALAVSSRSRRAISANIDRSDLVEEFGIAALLQRRIDELPYGLQKILNLALVSLADPKVLLLDEPFAGVFKGDVERLSSVIRRFARRGTAIVLVEHDIEAVMSLCERIAVLATGRIIFSGTPEEVRGSTDVKRVYLGSRGDSRSVASPRLGVPPAAEGVPQTERIDQGYVLQVQGLTAGYGKSTVLRGVDLTVRRGEVVALVGPNGAGKTTLLKAIAGLLKKSQAEITFGGKRIERLSPHALVRLGLTYVPEGREVFGQLTVEENLWLGAFSVPGRREDRMTTLLELFPQLRARLRIRAGRLSGGEQQMLAIARGLMSEPKLLLIDEPTLGLAPVMVEQLGLWLSEVRERLGTTLMIVEQSAKLATDLSDHMYVLVDGQVRGERTSSTFSEDELLALYFGTTKKHIEKVGHK